ncbi:MAG: Frag1/DRAM/Sfk1 family protein [Alcanivorax sp.]|nr:Frag1/DRAM/Sfk1 family protein [Alcanivorax sp.]
MHDGRAGTAAGMPLWGIALAAGLIPLLTIHVTFVTSVLEGHVPWCVPYWDACTSISRTGRHGSSYFIFKGAMLPAALLGIFFWWLNARWLRQLGVQNSMPAWLPWLGLVGCLFLAAYTMALGHSGDTLRMIRRTGVILYFSLTFIAQLLLSAALITVPAWQSWGRRLLRLCQTALAIGILSVILTVVAYPLYSQIDDAFEWILALLLNTHGLAVAWLWWKSGFRARLLTDP